MQIPKPLRDDRMLFAHKAPAFDYYGFTRSPY
jgi:hypothetical protein